MVCCDSFEPAAQALAKASGAVVDGFSIEKLKKKGINIKSIFNKNDSNMLFQNIGDAIYTGHTGTNVGDIVMVICI